MINKTDRPIFIFIMLNCMTYSKSFGVGSVEIWEQSWFSHEFLNTVEHLDCFISLHPFLFGFGVGFLFLVRHHVHNYFVRRIKQFLFDKPKLIYSYSLISARLIWGISSSSACFLLKKYWCFAIYVQYLKVSAAKFLSFSSLLFLYAFL